MKYTETKAFQEKAMKKYNSDVDGYLKEKQDLDEKEQKIAAAIGVLREHGDAETISEVLAYALMYEHRTHQQLVIGKLYRALQIYAEMSGSDARNEQAVAWAKEATKGEKNFPYI